MPKGLDYDKIVAEALRRLGQSGTIDDVKNIGGNLADDISKILSEATGKTPKPRYWKSKSYLRSATISKKRWRSRLFVAYV
jgi:hypothetical protein